MELIKVPRLRLTLLQTLAESTISICQKFPALNTVLQLAITVFETFKQAMVKEKASAKDKKRLDHERDEVLTGFVLNVKSELKFPHQDEIVKKALAELALVVRKYGMRIKRLPLDQETAALDNLLADIAEIDITPLDPTGLTRWIPELESANTRFKEAAQTFISDSVEDASTDAATKQAPELEDALEGLYAMMYAVLKTAPDAEMETAYQELEELVDSMK